MRYDQIPPIFKRRSCNGATERAAAGVGERARGEINPGRGIERPRRDP